jgi:hypothetical protein
MGFFLLCTIIISPYLHHASNVNIMNNIFVCMKELQTLTIITTNKKCWHCIMSTHITKWRKRKISSSFSYIQKIYWHHDNNLQENPKLKKPNLTHKSQINMLNQIELNWIWIQFCWIEFVWFLPNWISQFHIWIQIQSILLV